jgi:hypothetical protein
MGFGADRVSDEIRFGNREALGSKSKLVGTQRRSLFVPLRVEGEGSGEKPKRTIVKKITNVR